MVLQPVQYGYGYGYGYRPYGYRPYGYRPYGYPNRRFYNNHFGPGAAKERHRTRLDLLHQAAIEVLIRLRRKGPGASA